MGAVRFEPGRLIMHRNVRHGRIGWVRPGRVVSDDDRGLLVWIARDSPVAHEVTEAGLGMRAMPFAEWISSSYRLGARALERPAAAEVPAHRGGALRLVVPRRAGPVRQLVRQPGGARCPLGRRPGGRRRRGGPGPGRGGAAGPQLGVEGRGRVRRAARLRRRLLGDRREGGPRRGGAGDRARRGRRVPVRRHLVRLHPAARLGRTGRTCRPDGTVRRCAERCPAVTGDAVSGSDAWRSASDLAEWVAGIRRASGAL